MAFKYEVISSTDWLWRSKIHPAATWVEIEDLADAQDIKRTCPDLQVRPIDRWAPADRYSIDVLTQLEIRIPKPVAARILDENPAVPSEVVTDEPPVKDPTVPSDEKPDIVPIAPPVSDVAITAPETAPVEAQVEVAPVEVPVTSAATENQPVIAPAAEESTDAVPELDLGAAIVDAPPVSMEDAIKAAVPTLSAETLASALSVIQSNPQNLADALTGVRGIGKSTAARIVKAVTNG